MLHVTEVLHVTKCYFVYFFEQVTIVRGDTSEFFV